MRRFLPLLFAILIAQALTGGSAWAGSDDIRFHYQGRALFNGSPITGAGGIKLALVNPGAGITLWSNDASSVSGSEPASSVPLTIANGVYDIMVGDIALGMQPIPALMFNNRSDLRLRIWLNDGTHGFQMLTPDREIPNAKQLAVQISTQNFTLYVDGTNGSDIDTGFLPNHAKKTIQGAIDILPQTIRAGATIQITPGVYRETVNIQGITASSLAIVGDPTTVPTAAVDPTVRISGSDNDATPVRAVGFQINNCQAVSVKGIVVDHCSAYGIVSSFSRTVFTNCKSRNNNLDGYVESQGEAQNYSCVSLSNGRYGYNISQFPFVILSACTSNSNGASGIEASHAFVWLGDGSKVQSNAGSGAHISDMSILRITGSGATISSNGANGIRASYASHVQNNAGVVYSPANSGASTFTEFGSAIY